MAKENKATETNTPDIANMSQADYAKLRNQETAPTSEPSPTAEQNLATHTDVQPDGSDDPPEGNINEETNESDLPIWVGKRIDRVHRQLERQKAERDAERARREELERELEALKKGETKTEQKTEPVQENPEVPLERPDPTDYDTAQEFMEALEKWGDANGFGEQAQTEETEEPEDETVETKKPEDKEPEFKLTRPKKQKTAWDDLVEIIDDSENASDTMVSDLKELIVKEDIILNEDMVDWLIMNEDKAVDVISKFIETPRTARQISRMPKSKVKTKMLETADTELSEVQTVQSMTGVHEVRQKGIPAEVNIANMSQAEYNEMRFYEDNPHLRPRN